MTHKLPFMSIVICSYNGQAVIGRAIQSLLSLNYPKSRYEIIVVDDGSTDRTATIAEEYPVRLIRHQSNAGVAAARNTGLAAAKGDVYVSFDDDCVAAPDWLIELAKGYQLPNVAGVGSIIAHPEKLHGIADLYMAAVGSGNPPSIKLNARNNPLRRFLSYISQQLQPEDLSGIIPVRQINGASASFPVSVLRAVGGWDASLGWMEDTDICSRIAAHYPDRFFYAVTTAVLTHDPKLSFSQLIRRQINRGGANLAYYRRNNLIPPLFPFPIIWTLATITLLVITPFLVAITLSLILPGLLYFWWPVRAIREQKAHYMVLPYIQMSEELSGIIGLVRGYLANIRLSFIRKEPLS